MWDPCCAQCCGTAEECEQSWLLLACRCMLGGRCSTQNKEDGDLTQRQAAILSVRSLERKEQWEKWVRMVAVQEGCEGEG